MTDRPTIAVLVCQPLRGRVFSRETWDLLQDLGDVRTPAGETFDDGEGRRTLAGARACIIGWGSPVITSELLSDAPELGLLAHSAGSVKPYITDDVWDHGIRVTSASASLAVDVAWTTVGMIVLGLKNVSLHRDRLREGDWRCEGLCPPRELKGSVIGLVGASHVGRLVLDILKPTDATSLLYDPFCSSDEARGLGAEKVDDLDDLIRRSDVISIHAPSLPETRHMFNADNLALMKDNAVLINTARGALVDEEALVEVLRTRPVFAFIDVTDPEPPAADSPLRTLPNVLLTPHLAGSISGGVARLGEYAVEEVRRFLQGESLRYEVTRQMLTRMA